MKKEKNNRSQKNFESILDSNKFGKTHLSKIKGGDGPQTGKPITIHGNGGPDVVAE